MNPRGIHLRYTFEAAGQSGAEIENPLFDLLAAVEQQGSISQAAAALGLSYRHVWGALKHWETVLGQELVLWAKGKRARLSPYAQRLMWAERQARTRMTPHVEALRTELMRVFSLAEDPALQWLDVFASHDMALPRLQLLAEHQQGLHLNLRFAGSEEALRALLDGRCSVAGFHVPRLPAGSTLFAQALRPLLKPGRHKLISSHHRRQGLMWRDGPAAPGAPAGPLRDVADLLPTAGRPPWRFVNRQPGSGTRLLMDHLLAQAHLQPDQIEGYHNRCEHTHVAVAAAVAAGEADAGLGVEAAAREFGLAFQPLIDEDYYLVCLKDTLASPAVQALMRTLAAPAWALSLLNLPGCGTQQPGEVLSLTRALPWWHYPLPKRRAAAASA
jgi:putative molybdopterin biosynthesis protein